jgi:iron complex transport system substrate-binding protein
MPYKNSNYWAPLKISESAVKKQEEVRVYVCETGEVRVETKHFRTSFAPEDFILRVRQAIQRKAKKRTLPVFRASNKKNILSALLVFALSLFTFTGCTNKAANTEPSTATAGKRIVTVGSSVTEIAYALGAENKIVGVDTSSLYPEAATRLPQVGYQRQLSAEGVLSLKPNLVITVAEAGPPAALQQLEAAGVKVVKISGDNSIDGAKAKIREVAKVLGLEERGETAITKIDAELAKANDCAAGLSSKPKVLFIYARGAGAAQVGGRNTAADEMIKLAGGANAITEFENYKPLTPESLVAAAPDVILLPTRGLESLGGTNGLLKLPGISETLAGKNKRIVTVDDLLLLGFSPRVGEGVLELCEKLRQ